MITHIFLKVPYYNNGLQNPMLIVKAPSVSGVWYVWFGGKV